MATSIVATFAQTANERLDYVLDWIAQLATGETIAAASVTSSVGAVIGSGPYATTYTATSVTFWVQSVTAQAVVTVQITTSSGRLFERRIQITTA